MEQLFTETQNKVSKDIENKREEMVDLGGRHGFLHPRVQLASKQLDQLLLKYYALHHKDTRGQHGNQKIEK